MKLGLVLEGGASRAYFSVGAMDALLDLNINADYVIGTSAGIANGASYISEQKGRNLEIGLKYLSDKRYMGIKYMLDRKNRSYYNIDFVFDKIPNEHLPFDYEKFQSFKGGKIAVVTNIETGSAEYMPIDGKDTKWKAVEASCALPILFKPVEIDGKLYFDGGLSDSIPFRHAMEDGCDKIITIITRERSYVKTVEPAIKIGSFMYRKYPNLVKTLESRAASYNKSHSELIRLEKEGKIFLIAPNDTKNWKRTEKSPEAVRKMYDIGYNTVMHEAEKIEEYIKN